MNHLASESSEFFSFLILRRRSLNKACSCLFSRSSSVLAKRGKHNFWNISKSSQTLKRLLQRLKRARRRHRINFTIPVIIVKNKKNWKTFFYCNFLIFDARTLVFSFFAANCFLFCVNTILIVCTCYGTCSKCLKSWHMGAKKVGIKNVTTVLFFEIFQKLFFPC